jgi:hypothetical protein
MRRLLRILLNAATVVSLLLCLGMSVLWARSKGTSDELEMSWSRSYGIYSLQNAVYFAVVWHEARPSGGDFRISVRTDYREGSGLFCFAAMNDFGRRIGPIGLARADGDLGLLARSWGTQWFRILAVPHWLLAVAFAALPLGRWWRWMRRRRRRPSACASCGYDLRATPERCPECGTVPNAQPATPVGWVTGGIESP